VFDTAGGTDLGPYRGRLLPGGRMIAIAPSTPRTIMSIVASTVHGQSRIRFFSGNAKRRDLDALAAYVERGDLAPVVAGVYPLTDIAAAHRAFEAGGAVGKQIVEIAAPAS
jgi:NADPH:quinone reductase-like Zn-dependent oxidoreductase